jgi:hypothetical protein
VEAWGRLTLAYYTDWPTSFPMRALSGLVYLLSLAPVSGRNEAPIGLELPRRFLLGGLATCYRLEIAWRKSWRSHHGAGSWGVGVRCGGDGRSLRVFLCGAVIMGRRARRPTPSWRNLSRLLGLPRARHRAFGRIRHGFDHEAIRAARQHRQELRYRPPRGHLRRVGSVRGADMRHAKTSGGAIAGELRRMTDRPQGAR